MDIKVTIIKCARCGQNHVVTKWVEFQTPVDMRDAGIFRYWAPCPTNGDPILMSFEVPKDLDLNPEEEDQVQTFVDMGYGNPNDPLKRLVFEDATGYPYWGAVITNNELATIINREQQGYKFISNNMSSSIMNSHNDAVDKMKKLIVNVP